MRYAVAVSCLLALAAPSASLAASGTDGYENKGAEVQGLVQSGGGGGGAETSPASASTSTLPFTGAELGISAGIGGVLILMGFALRRMTSRPADS